MAKKNQKNVNNEGGAINERNKDPVAGGKSKPSVGKETDPSRGPERFFYDWVQPLLL